uniref:Uncharacterized protein n=1 Tax=Glossina austeni TaxID=7395 RepID=A0A1A9VGQ9_GLOAU
MKIFLPKSSQKIILKFVKVFKASGQVGEHGTHPIETSLANRLSLTVRYPCSGAPSSLQIILSAKSISTPYEVQEVQLENCRCLPIIPVPNYCFLLPSVSDK